MLPYVDDTPSYSVPVWIFILIALNVLFYIMSVSGGHDQYVRTIFSYGTIPARFTQPADQPIKFDEDILSYIRGAGVRQSEWAAPLVTLFTAMFLHGGLFHLLGNMWFLWLFGDNVEDRIGKLMFPVFYIICGFCAGLLHIALQPDSTVPAIGASGAIAGVMGAYIFLFPRGTISTLIAYWWYWTTVHISAPLYIGLWFIFQLIGGLSSGGGSNVAFWAHVGGFIAGLMLAMIFSALGLIRWYPGDRGYKDFSFLKEKPIRATRPELLPPGRRKRYVWRD